MNRLGRRVADILATTGFAVECVEKDAIDLLTTTYMTPLQDLEWQATIGGWAEGAQTNTPWMLAAVFSPSHDAFPGTTGPKDWRYSHPELDEVINASIRAAQDPMKDLCSPLRSAVRMGLTDAYRLLLIAVDDS